MLENRRKEKGRDRKKSEPNAVQTVRSVIREDSAFYYRTFKASLSNIVFAVQDVMLPFHFLPSSQPRHFGFSSSHAASSSSRSLLVAPSARQMGEIVPEQRRDLNSIARGDFLDRL